MEGGWGRGRQYVPKLVQEADIGSCRFLYGHEVAILARTAN